MMVQQCAFFFLHKLMSKKKKKKLKWTIKGDVSAAIERVLKKI